MGILLFRSRGGVGSVAPGIGVFCSQRASILRDLGGIELHVCYPVSTRDGKSCCYCGGMIVLERAESAFVDSGA